jgi:hypothetical protein
MRPTGEELAARLASADPASGLEFDDGFRERVWQEVAARRALSARRTPRRWRPQLRVVTLAVPLALLLAGGAGAAVSGLIRIGAAATPFHFASPQPLGLGPAPVESGAVRLLSVVAADPQGGPAWGLRVVTTTTGHGCIEVGRVLDGRFGGLGEDGSFDDDGAFHPVPAVDAENAAACAPLDRSGRLFYNVASAVGTASGTFFVPGGCVSSRAFAPVLLRMLERHPTDSDLCPAASNRTLIYGLLGPDAESITYTLDGRSHLEATAGPQGAYLIVASGARSADPELGELPFAAGTLPVDTPITVIRYRGGVVCRLLGARHDGRTADCLPGGHPVGYTPAETSSAGRRR